jgi:cellulose synthase/poly-beta-1,6-N-acetylglucosamine synthase-like glycosyltransferase
LVCLFAFIKDEEKEEVIQKKHKFMAVISARNEEKVIANLVESLLMQDYDKDKLDIYVIADNCTDKTAKVAKKAGAIVYERFDKTKRSKGYALEWFFDKILVEKPDDYDAFCVFDADNIVSKDFISKMNKKLCKGELIVQGYRDIKNAKDTWVTGNYALFYWTMNRFYHYARYKLGLSPLVNGTGFMVAMSVIKETNGWHTETLTEDIEFSLNSIARGHKIGWAHDAIVYDEQPLGFKQSWTQRMRWAVGHIQCLKACLPNLIKQQRVTPSIVDAIIYNLGMPFILLSLFILSINLFKYILLPTILWKYAKDFASWIGVIVLIPMFQSALVVVLERKNIRAVWKGIITYPIFLLSWVLINISAFFNTKMEWKQISHVRSVKIQEIR